MSETETANDHPSQMSLEEARRALGNVEVRLGELLANAAAAHKQARANAHEWARKRRKSLTRYIAVLETEEPLK